MFNAPPEKAGFSHTKYNYMNDENLFAVAMNNGGVSVLTVEKPAKERRRKIPKELSEIHRREKRWIQSRWAEIAEHLKIAHDLVRAEKERLCREYAGPQGSLIMQKKWQLLAELWSELDVLNDFPVITGEPNSNSINGLLSEMERSSRMTNSWLRCMSVYTGCKDDPNRYQAQVTEDEK